jgi:hypothetical protein
MRGWRACAAKPPPLELAALSEFLMAGCGINLLGQIPQGLALQFISFRRTTRTTTSYNAAKPALFQPCRQFSTLFKCTPNSSAPLLQRQSLA